MNAYCVKLVGNCIKIFLNEQFFHTPVGLTIEKKELFIVLSYLDNLPLPLITCLRNSINKILPYCKIRVFINSRIRSTVLCFKDKVPFYLRSNVVYKILCDR